VSQLTRRVFDAALAPLAASGRLRAAGAEALSAQRKLAAVAELAWRRRSGEERSGHACSETGQFWVAEVGVALTR